MLKRYLTKCRSRHSSLGTSCSMWRRGAATLQSSPSAASKGASRLTTPRTYCTMPSNFRYQTYISPILISLFYNLALHLHIHVFCYFDKHMCQLLSSRSNFPFDVFSFRLLINFRCLLNCQRKYAGIKTTEWHLCMSICLVSYYWQTSILIFCSAAKHM